MGLGTLISNVFMLGAMIIVVWLLLDIIVPSLYPEKELCPEVTPQLATAVSLLLLSPRLLS